MPVSLLPLAIPFLIVAALVFGSLGGWRRLRWAMLGSLAVVALVVGPFYAKGVWLYSSAEKGGPRAQYEYARWLENSPESIGSLILWPTTPDVLGGYEWLEKSAEAGYPPAKFALGVRLKYGEFVPEPKGWTGPGGVYPQRERGQKMIDEASSLGFRRSADEEKTYYWTVYRNPAIDDVSG